MTSTELKRLIYCKTLQSVCLLYCKSPAWAQGIQAFNRDSPPSTRSTLYRYIWGNANISIGYLPLSDSSGGDWWQRHWADGDISAANTAEQIQTSQEYKFFTSSRCFSVWSRLAHIIMNELARHFQHTFEEKAALQFQPSYLLIPWGESSKWTQVSKRSSQMKERRRVVWLLKHL